MVKLGDGKKLLRWLKGQRRAQDVIEAEQSQNLPRMSRSARLAAFNALCDLWRSRTVTRQDKLDAIRVPSIVQLRRRLQRASEAFQRERNR